MRLPAATTRLKESGRKALVPFFTAGYPDERTFADLVRGAVAAGADVIEIGVPFSDPIADGPVIQASSTAALAAGMSLARALGLARELSSEITTPMVIMSYANPILTYGLDRFVSDASGAGVSGLILPDVSFEESGPFRDAARAGLSYIDLLAPTSSDERVDAIARRATGFVYLVSMTGVTGAEASFSDELTRFVARVREHTATPLYVGFGVSTPEQAAAVVESADGVIIGSRLIRLVDENGPGEAAARVSSFLADVRRSLDNSTATG